MRTEPLGRRPRKPVERHTEKLGGDEAAIKKSKEHHREKELRTKEYLRKPYRTEQRRERRTTRAAQGPANRKVLERQRRAR